ncbi:MAG: molybdopterin-dependent oxidoreductase [Chloroflexi bacterium]|nr:molybdopterin-dependent oxidoreductase [Chloroflexota bacterium]
MAYPEAAEAGNERPAVERIIRELSQQHQGTTTAYTGCKANCGGTSQCVLKAHVRDGRVVTIEPDDRYNRGVGREDRTLSDLDLVHAKVQRRACPMGWMWHKHLHDPNRILNPLKRRAGSRRGDADFQRVSWDEALDTIVERMTEYREEFGPYSIMTPFWPNANVERLFGFWGAGLDTWGWCSCDSERLATHLTAGRMGWEAYGSSSAADVLFNSRLIVLWGFDPTTAHHGPGHQLAWYIKMARERGTPVICIDPRYTMAAEVLADQWIPIKPGTDMAFILAIAHILFEEKLYDEDFVRRFVDVEGIEKWRRYVLGLDDGVAKTPHWAENICGIPAYTIAEFARLYARSKPTWLYKHWAVARKSRGENSARGAAALQAMMGYFGLPGGIMPYYFGAWPKPAAARPLGDAPTGYVVPKICRSHKWAQAILLLDEVNTGELSPDDWRAQVGYKGAPELPLPEEFHPKMLWWGGLYHTGSNHLSTGCDSTHDQIRALHRLDFVLTTHTAMTPTARYADLILPAMDPMWEQLSVLPSSYGGFSSISCGPGVAPAPGEVRPMEWILTKIAVRLGFGKEFNRYYTTDERWDEDWERYQRESYEECAEKLEFPTPSWEEFKAGEFIHLDEHHDRPFFGFTREIEQEQPFLTQSGKFEVHSHLIANEEQRGRVHRDHLGRLIDNLPNDWRDLQPLPVYQPAVRGLEDELGHRYPLMMLTPHSRYRVHSLFWTVPWLRGDVYRHAVWLSVADAQTRGISDGEVVRVFNDKGEIFLPAYVTSRIPPGVTVVRQGAWYSPEGGIAPHVLLGDSDSPPTPAPASTLVQVEKAKE